MSGLPWLSPSRPSSLAPPSDLMPPAALISSMAINAPWRHWLPEKAMKPVTGWMSPTFTGAGLRPQHRRESDRAHADCGRARCQNVAARKAAFRLVASHEFLLCDRTPFLSTFHPAKRVTAERLNALKQSPGDPPCYRSSRRSGRASAMTKGSSSACLRFLRHGAWTSRSGTGRAGRPRGYIRPAGRPRRARSGAPR